MSELDRMSLDVLRADRSLFSQELLLATMATECRDPADDGRLPITNSTASILPSPQDVSSSPVSSRESAASRSDVDKKSTRPRQSKTSGSSSSSSGLAPSKPKTQ